MVLLLLLAFCSLLSAAPTCCGVENTKRSIKRSLSGNFQGIKGLIKQPDPSWIISLRNKESGQESEHLCIGLLFDNSVRAVLTSASCARKVKNAFRNPGALQYAQPGKSIRMPILREVMVQASDNRENEASSSTAPALPSAVGLLVSDMTIKLNDSDPPKLPVTQETLSPGVKGTAFVSTEKTKGGMENVRQLSAKIVETKRCEEAGLEIGGDEFCVSLKATLKNDPCGSPFLVKGNGGYTLQGFFSKAAQKDDKMLATFKRVSVEMANAIKEVVSGI